MFLEEVIACVAGVLTAAVGSELAALEDEDDEEGEIRDPTLSTLFKAAVTATASQVHHRLQSSNLNPTSHFDLTINIASSICHNYHFFSFFVNVGGYHEVLR